MQMSRRFPALFHLASSGGTTITRLLLTHLKVVVANEVAPFNARAGFNPGYPFGLLQPQLQFSQEDFRALWDYQMNLIASKAQELDKQVLLRVHSHSDYFAKTAAHSREALDKWIGSSAVTVRNPLTNYVSAKERGFFKGTLGDWSSRCQRFIGDYEQLPRFRFEDIMTNPDEALMSLQSHLDLELRETPLDPPSLPALSGDNREKTPVTGVEFVEKEEANRERILADDGYRGEVADHIDELNQLQLTLGYQPTQVDFVKKSQE